MGQKYRKGACDNFSDIVSFISVLGQRTVFRAADRSSLA